MNSFFYSGKKILLRAKDNPRKLERIIKIRVKINELVNKV